MVLVIDNYDSFTWNLVQLLGSLGARVQVVLNDQFTARELLERAPTHLVVSPGPGSPDDAGVSVEAILTATVPVLGVCLGHQSIAAAFGGRVVCGPSPVHGRASPIHHDGAGLFEGVPQGFSAARYHSLVVERASLPSCLRVTAWTDDGLIMGLRHTSRPIVGVQFHPESVLTTEGATLVRNFLHARAQPRA